MLTKSSKFIARLVLFLLLFTVLKSNAFTPLESQFACNFPEQDSISLQDIESFVAVNTQLYGIWRNWEKSKILCYSIRVIREDCEVANYTNLTNTMTSSFRQILLNVEVEDVINIYDIYATKDNLNEIPLPEITKTIVPKKKGYQLKRICPFRENVHFKGTPEKVVEIEIDAEGNQSIMRQIEFDDLGRVIFFKGRSILNIYHLSYKLSKTLEINYLTNSLLMNKDSFQFKNQERMISFIATLGYGSIVSNELDSLFFNSSCWTHSIETYDDMSYSLRFCYEHGLVKELYQSWYPPSRAAYNFEYGRNKMLTYSNYSHKYGATGKLPPASYSYYKYEFDAIDNWIVRVNSEDSKIVRRIVY